MSSPHRLRMAFYLDPSDDVLGGRLAHISCPYCSAEVAVCGESMHSDVFAIEHETAGCLQ